MLRKIIMLLALFVAFLPYLGIPRKIDMVLFTATGLLIFFLLVFTKKNRAASSLKQAVKNIPALSEQHDTNVQHVDKNSRTEQRTGSSVLAPLSVQSKQHREQKTAPRKELSIARMLEEHVATLEIEPTPVAHVHVEEILEKEVDVPIAVEHAVSATEIAQQSTKPVRKRRKKIVTEEATSISSLETT